VNRTGLTLSNLNNTFFIGSVNPGFTSLPLDLLYFKGLLNNGQVVLNWATPSDNDALWFTVQRSKDGSAWDDRQQIQADSIGTVTHYYSAVDPTPWPATSFYRLRQTDINGNSLYSSVLAFNQNAQSGAISIYPVPATDRLTVSFPEPGNYLVQLLNSIGQQVRGTLSSSGTSMTWSLSGLPAGVYFVRTLHNGTMESQTVLIR
jgi:hypothetical protein